MTGLLQDVRYALRQFRKSPGFTAIALITLALGIGAATIIYGVFYNVVLNPFPYKNSDRLITFAIENLSNKGASAGRNFFSIPEFLAFREQNHVFEDIAGYDGRGGLLSNDGNPTHELRGGAVVTPNTFELFGVQALLGRGLAPQDGKPGAPPVFVMNYGLWQTEFGGNPLILGSRFVVNGEPRTLVGIMPRRCNIYDASIWVPANLTAGGYTGTLTIVGRLKSGITLKAAAADLDVIAHRLTKAEAGFVLNPEQYTVVPHSLIDAVLGNFREGLYALLAAVVMVLLVACANVANLLLARATFREREIAMRTVLGASRARLIRQLLVESLVLSALGCVIGCGFAYLGLRAVAAVIPQDTVPREAEITLNSPVLWFAIAATILTTFLCGLTPALHGIRGDLQPRLSGGGKSAGGGFRQGKFRAGLVISEVALSIVLLVGAGLTMRNFAVLTGTALPFDPAKTLYLRLDLPRHYYGKPDSKPAFFQQVLPRIEALPGVVSATESWMMPPNEGAWTDVAVPGKPHAERWTTDFELCTEGYFRTLGLQLLRGRLLSQDDIDLARHVAVVNETLARQYFGEQEPLGQKIKFEVFDRPFLDAPHNAYFEIVGVVKDSRTRPERAQYVLRPDAFLPLSVANLQYSPSILVRTAVDPHSLLKSVQREIWAVDPDVACRASGSVEDFLKGEFKAPQFEFIAFGAFAGIGLTLAMTGVFAVVAYTVAQSTREIGIRLALGALPGEVVYVVLKKGAVLISAGIVIGLLVSFGLSRFLASLLWAVSPTDSFAFASVVPVLALTGLAACYIPARRAARVDPMVALRYE